MTKPILTAKKGTNADLFPDILELYAPPGARVLDMTFGNGVFWKNVGPRNYELVKNDIDPHRGDCSYDFRDLPKGWSAIFDAVVFDPPYKMTGATQGDDRYGNKSNGYLTVKDAYKSGIDEAHRVLKQDGILIVKCMDSVAFHKQHWIHVDVFVRAIALGMVGEDLFVMVRSSARTQPHKNQVHGWKNHSFFWVFRK